MAETFDALLKVVVIGDTSVGKTCLILRYSQDIFREHFLSTIGVDFKTKTVDVGRKRFKLQIWDTAGQERYNTIRKGFYRGAKGVVVVYDITNPDSFASLTKWISDITNNCVDGLERPAIMILANKVDKEHERKIATLTGKQASLEFGTRFAEVSAKTGAGIDEAFENFVEDIARVFDRQESNSAEGTVKLNYSSFHQYRQPRTCPC